MFDNKMKKRTISTYLFHCVFILVNMRTCLKS